MVKNAIFLLLLLFLAAPLPFAQDFGLIINQKAVFADGPYAEYTPMAIPWFAAPLGKRADLYLSAGVGAEMEATGGKLENSVWKFLFEVYRFEVTFNPSANLGFGIGRQSFSDSLGFVMSGLFDGASVTWDVGGGRLNFGAFYTGLLYKKTALILLSPYDLAEYSDEDVYFASRRLAGGINWEKTSVSDSGLSMWLSGIFQVDLNDTSDKFHSQYLAAKIAGPFGGGALNYDFGGALAMLQTPDFEVGFAASANLYWLFYGAVPGMLSLGGRYASGDGNKALTAFAPITGESQGRVLRPNLSGIAMAQAVYAARLHRTLFAELFAGYLFDTNSGMSKDSVPLGGEFFLGLSWAPFSDLVFSAGGGVFLPQMGGKAYENDQIKYRVEITADISF